MKQPDRVRISVRNDQGEVHKVTSIYLLSDGSLKIDVPYCKHQCGVLQKLTFPSELYSRLQSVIPLSDTTAFLAKSRPQRSVPSSGFVQFSGSGITSGIDEGGCAKGLGLWSAPLTEPIQSGLTCGIRFWGLNQGYESVAASRNIDIVYADHEFIPRLFPGDLSANAFQLEMWVFLGVYQKFIWKDENGVEKVTRSFGNYLHAPGVTFTMQVIRLQKITSFLALLPSKINLEFATRANCGFSLGSPQVELMTDAGV